MLLMGLDKARNSKTKNKNKNNYGTKNSISPQVFLGHQSIDISKGIFHKSPNINHVWRDMSEPDLINVKATRKSAQGIDPTIKKVIRPGGNSWQSSCFN